MFVFQKVQPGFGATNLLGNRVEPIFQCRADELNRGHERVRRRRGTKRREPMLQEVVREAGGVAGTGFGKSKKRRRRRGTRRRLWQKKETSLSEEQEEVIERRRKWWEREEEGLEVVAEREEEEEEEEEEATLPHQSS